MKALDPDTLAAVMEMLTKRIERTFHREQSALEIRDSGKDRERSYYWDEEVLRFRTEKNELMLVRAALARMSRNGRGR